MTGDEKMVKMLISFVPQSVSSDRSRQSAPPSHFQLPWMHSPLPHWNSSDEHWWVAAEAGLFVPQVCAHSSEPSEQSTSPSHNHRRGIQTVLLHWKDIELQVTGGQEASSLPSSQSASSSHTKEDDTHWPFLQLNSAAVHCFGAEMRRHDDEEMSTTSDQEGSCRFLRWGSKSSVLTHHSSLHQLHSHSQLFHHSARSWVYTGSDGLHSWTLSVYRFWPLEGKWTENRYNSVRCEFPQEKLV